MHAKMAATLVRALVFFIISINVLAFKDRHNALNGNLTCYSNCWTAKPAISHSFVLNHRLKRCVVRWDSGGLVYLAAPEDSVLLSTLLTMPDIHPNPGPQDGQQENRLVDGVDLTTAHRDSSNGSNGGADTILFRSRNDLLSLRRFAWKPQAPVLNTLKQLGILRYRGRSRVKNRAADAFLNPNKRARDGQAIEVVKSRRPVKSCSVRELNAKRCLTALHRAPVKRKNFLVCGVHNPPKHSYNEGDLMNHLLSFVDQTMDSHPRTVVVCGGDLNQLNIKQFEQLT